MQLAMRVGTDEGFALADTYQHQEQSPARKTWAFLLMLTLIEIHV